MDQNNQNQPTEPQPQVPSFQPTAPAVESASVQPTPGQPMASPQPMMQAPVAEKDAGRTLGIVSLVMSLLGLGLVGIVLGILALSKSKKSGHKTNIMGLIGIIWGVVSGFFILILVGLVLSNFQAAQDKARDTTSITRVNAVHSKLEEYYNESNFYPETMEISNFPGISPNSLKSGSETQIVVIKDTKNEIEAVAQADPNTNVPYQYIPFNCTNGQCKGYILRVHLDKPSSVYPNPYTKRGLNN